MRRIAVLATVGVVLLVLVVAQLVLPGIAAHRLRDSLARSGTVLEVKVSAFPAIKLLWHRADHVVIRMGRYSAGKSQIGGELGETGDAGSIDASAQVVNAGLLTLHDASLRKRGNTLSGTGTVAESDLRSAVPFLDDVQLIASRAGRITLRGTASLLGLSATVDATVLAQNGQLLVVPDVPFGGLATVTLFSQPNVQVQSVSASDAPGGFSISASAIVG